MRRPPLVELIADHLKRRGHISAGSALVEYGYFRLPDVIHRLRNERRDLIPDGMEVVTVHKKDTRGNDYGEYTLVDKRSAAAREQVTKARAREMVGRVRRQLDTTEHRLTYRDDARLHQSLVG